MKKALLTMLSASLVCAAAATVFAACGEAKTYKVTYAGGGTAVTGTAPVEGEHAKDDKFTLKENTFTNEGYEFDGWTYGGNTYEAGAQFTMPESDVTFTAKWLELFTVTYAWDGAEKPAGAAAETVLPDAKEVADGKAYTLPTLAAAENYTFTGWKIGATAEVKAGGSSYTVTGDITLTAMFVREGYYSVIYSLGDHAAADATVPTQEDAQKDAEVILAGAPAAAEGWKFAGWEVKQGESDVAVADGKFTMPEGNVTITAKWERVYAVQFLVSEDATEGVSVNYVKTDKLGEGENYPVNIKNADGFTVKEWAVKGNTSVKATADTVIETLFGNEDATLSLYPVSYHLEIGAKDHTNGYPGLEAAWNTTIQKGEKIELKGTMTSAATQNWETVFVYIWSTELKGALRLDNYIVDREETNGTVLSAAEKWTISRDIIVNWDNFKTIVANCDLTVTLNWISDSKIVLTMQATKGDDNIVQTYTIAPAANQSFAESYKFGLNSEKSYAEITEMKKHAHVYGSDDVCTVEGCDQVNPVHTAHNWVKGVCTVCQEDCAHETVSGNACSVCGAAVTSVTPSVTAYDTTAFNSNILGGLTLNKGNVLVVSGVQTRANNAQNYFSILFEIPGQAVFRTDQFGASIGTMFEGGDWANGGFGSSNKNTITGAVTKDGNPAAGDYWANVKGMKSNCTWTITVDYRNTDKLLAQFVLVGADGTEYAGITYTVNFSIAFKAGQTPASLNLQFGAENAAGTFANVTTYSWAE